MACNRSYPNAVLPLCSLCDDKSPHIVMEINSNYRNWVKFSICTGLISSDAYLPDACLITSSQKAHLMHRKFQPKYFSLFSLILYISNHHGIVQKAKFHPLVTHTTLSKNYLSTLRLNFGKIMAFLLNQNYLVTPNYVHYTL